MDGFGAEGRLPLLLPCCGCQFSVGIYDFNKVWKPFAFDYVDVLVMIWRWRTAEFLLYVTTLPGHAEKTLMSCISSRTLHM